MINYRGKTNSVGAVGRFLLVTLLGLLTSCWEVFRVAPRPTAPATLTNPEIAQLRAPSFANLTHPDISPYWGRRKADGEEKFQNTVTGPFGINWIPVVSPTFVESTTARLPKRTVCGPLHDAQLFTGDDPTSERDWNLLISPTDDQYIDSRSLVSSAARLRSLKLDLSIFFTGSGKYYNTSFWHHDYFGRYLVEAEITAPLELLKSANNPFPCVAAPKPDRSATMSDLDGGGASNAPSQKIVDCKMHKEEFQRLRAPSTLCAYGPYVQEAMHGFRPEIHPAEGLWFQLDGVWHLVMTLDASRRFDASSPREWLTVIADQGAPANNVCAEHWVQEAMIGEWLLPLVPGTKPAVSVAYEQGLEPIGAGEYPKWALDPNNAGSQLDVEGDQDHAIVAFIENSDGESPVLVIRAQIRGAPHAKPLENAGAALYLRVGPLSR